MAPSGVAATVSGAPPRLVSIAGGPVAVSEVRRRRAEPTQPASTQSPGAKTTSRVDGAVSSRELEDVVKRAQRGDTAAFAELFRKHRNTVAAIAYRMLGPGADLEDMVQEVFLQVHRSLPDFRGQAKFSTWLHRVAVNVVLMARRRARSRPQYAQEEHARHEPDLGPTPDQEVARGRRIEAFQRLLGKLSEKKRDVFVLHELEGLPPAEIAKIVDCPVLTVRTRLFYARRELAQMMRAEPALVHLLNDGHLDDAKKTRHSEPFPKSEPKPQLAAVKETP